ncbi:hypothetical protein KZW96_07660 [Streptococcus halitosis]|uniref:hypothetical protein n=1 Tax=Streptococcus halitosis TaxID=2172545 RepID=UPI00200320E7|nr:hypothetical protein [Streptococcus halitosis]MCK6129407.1 hypothetical protein [Streptococcus halitosis]MCK6216410.1 hypothetical protein [Streptococcus halitosis]
MPKPMLNPYQSQKQTQVSHIMTSNLKQPQIDKLSLDRLLRKSRSKEYMDAIHQLDAGGHVHNKKEVNEIINTIKLEFPDVGINGILLGFVAKCYLGAPYEAHTLDLVGEIIEHYKRGETLPGGLDKAKSIALHGGYDFIEVYTDCCRAISSNGSVSVIKD